MEKEENLKTENNPSLEKEDQKVGSENNHQKLHEQENTEEQPSEKTLSP